MDHTLDRQSRATFRAVLAGGHTRVLLGTVLLYGLAFQLEILGLAVLVYARSSSPLLSALTFGIGFGPQVFGGAFLTSLADRYPAHLVIATGLLVRAAPGLAIGLGPGMPIWLMLLLVGAAALLAPVFSAASGSLLSDLLHGDTYVLGRSILAMLGSGTQIVGLGIGGAALTLLAPPDLLLGAGGLLLLAGAFAGIRLRSVAASERHPSARGILRSSLAGNAGLLRDPTVRGLLLAQWLPVWFLTGAESLIVSYVGSRGEPASAAGALLAALPVGMLVGDLLIGRIVRPRARERLALPLAVAMGLPLLVFSLGPALPVAAVLLGVSGLCTGYQVGLQRAFLESIPDGHRGQAFGLASTGLMGGQGISPPLVGAMAGLLGVGGAMAAAGAVAAVCALSLHRALSPARPS